MLPFDTPRAPTYGGEPVSYGMRADEANRARGTGLRSEGLTRRLGVAVVGRSASFPGVGRRNSARGRYVIG